MNLSARVFAGKMQIAEIFRRGIRDLVRWLIDPLGCLIGWIWFDVLRIRRRVAIENVARAFPDLASAEQVRIARSSLQHMGRTLVEFLLFPILKTQDLALMFEFIGNPSIESALGLKRGALLLTLHLGNGDLAVAALAKNGWNVSLISKRLKPRWLNELWFKMRERHGTRFISPEKSSFEILRALKGNRLVVFVLDQFMGPPVGCKTKFFGVETGTAMGLAVIAERTGAPVIPCYTYRFGNGRYRNVFGEPIPWRDLGPKASRDENIAAMTQVYTDKIEDIVREHPEQWMWIHRRWKKFA